MKTGMFTANDGTMSQREQVVYEGYMIVTISRTVALIVEHKGSSAVVTDNVMITTR